MQRCNVLNFIRQLLEKIKDDIDAHIYKEKKEKEELMSRIEQLKLTNRLITDYSLELEKSMEDCETILEKNFLELEEKFPEMANEFLEKYPDIKKLIRESKEKLL